MPDKKAVHYLILRPACVATFHPECPESVVRTTYNPFREDLMSRSMRAVAIAALLLTPAAVLAQAPTPAPAHVIVVKMVEISPTHYAFEPANITAEPGDTVRFVQASTVPHNVSFRSHPSGAKLGSAAVGPYVINKGDSYNLVIDGRFSVGTYKFACDPHEMMGMKGVLTVQKSH